MARGEVLGLECERWVEKVWCLAYCREELEGENSVTGANKREECFGSRHTHQFEFESGKIQVRGVVLCGFFSG